MIYKTNLSVNSDIDFLVNAKNNWVCRDFLITENEKKNNYIVYCAWKIQEICETKTSINAKFKYWFRDIRIEIAFYYLEKLFLIKTIKEKTKFDKEALKLDSIISEITKKYPDKTIIGCFFVSDKNEFKDMFFQVSKILKNKFILASEEDIYNNIFKYGLSNK